MSLTVWRFEFDVADQFEFVAPDPAIVLSVRAHRQDVNKIELWAAVDTSNDDVSMIRRTICVVGTGQPIPPEFGEPLGATRHGVSDEAIFHLFALAPERLTSS